MEATYAYLWIFFFLEIERSATTGDMQVLIHFDGWGPSYDYWATLDSVDLHPIGFMEEVGIPKRVHKGTMQLQIPHSEL